MSKPSSGRTLGRLLLLALLVGAALAIRNAFADKGGSYDPADDV